jgi:hypothetical protein
VSEQDPYTPTTAGPEPEVAPEAAATPEPPPAFAPPPVDPHPERKVGAAFAGGVAAAVFLKILANRRHR